MLVKGLRILSIVGIIVVVVAVGGSIPTCSAQYLSGKWSDQNGLIQYVVQRDTSLFATLSSDGHWHRANGSVIHGKIEMSFYYGESTEIILNADVQNSASQIVWANGIVWQKQRTDLSMLWLDNDGGLSISLQQGTQFQFNSINPIGWHRAIGELNGNTMTAEFDDFTYPTGQLSTSIEGVAQIKWDNGHVWTQHQCSTPSSEVDGFWFALDNENDSKRNYLVSCGSKLYAGSMNNVDFDRGIGDWVDNKITMTYYNWSGSSEILVGRVSDDRQRIQWNDSPANMWKRVTSMSDLWIQHDQWGKIAKLNIIVDLGVSLFFGYVEYRNRRELWTRGIGERYGDKGSYINATFNNGVTLTGRCNDVWFQCTGIPWSNHDGWQRAMS